MTVVATLPPAIKFQPLVGGSPLPGGRVLFYAAGSTTPQAVYDSAGTSLGAVLTLDANGSTSFRLASGQIYKIEVQDANYITQVGWPEDYVVGLDGVLVNLSDPNNDAFGDALLAVKQPFAGAGARTQHSKNTDFLTPEDFLAVGDGVADDTIPLRNWASSGGKLAGSPKVYKVTGTVTFPTNIDLDARGMVINGTSGSSWTNSSVVNVTGSISALPNLSVSPSAGDQTLTFASNHGLTGNDVFIIYNPTDGSWLPSRTYYRAGEWCRPIAVGPTTVKLWNPLYAGYTFGAVTCWKLATNRVGIRNLRVIAPGSGSIRPLRIQLATRVRLSNVEGSGSDYTGIELDRCYDVEVDGNTQFVQPVVYNDEYAVSIGNCQKVHIRGGSLNASRHCVAIGGDDVTGCVPNRDIWVNGCSLSNDPDSGAPACDVHGNCQDIHYVDSEVYGGASFNGKDIFYDGCSFMGAPVGNGALIAGGSESMGGVYSVRNSHLKGTGAYASGLVRAYVGQYATDTTLVVEGCSLEAGTCDTLARVDFHASATAKGNASVTRITVLSGASLANICRMVGTGAGGDGAFVVVDGITNAPSGCALYTAASGYGSTVKCRLQQQTGILTVTPVSAANIASASVVFRYSYGSKTPNITLCQSTSEVNSKTIGNRYGSLSATGLTGYIWTTDRTNFAATTPDVTLQWTAGLSEI